MTIIWTPSTSRFKHVKDAPRKRIGHVPRFSSSICISNACMKTRLGVLDVLRFFLFFQILGLTTCRFHYLLDIRLIKLTFGLTTLRSYSITRFEYFVRFSFFPDRRFRSSYFPATRCLVAVILNRILDCNKSQPGDLHS